MSHLTKCLLPACSLALLCAAAAAPARAEELPQGVLARFGKPRLGHVGSTINVAFAPDGKTLASVGGREDMKARIWDTATGRKLAELIGHTDSIQGVAWTPDGKSIVTGSHDNTVRLWDVATGKEVRQYLGHTDGILPIAVSPDGKLIASEAQDLTVRIWELATGKELHQLAGHQTEGTSNLAFSLDSKVLATVGADTALRFWDTATGKEVLKLDGHGADVNSLDFSSDGKLLASAGNDNTIRLWDTATGKEVRKLTGHDGLGATVRFTPDARKVVSGSMDRTIRVWDVATGKELMKAFAHATVVSELAVSPDGKRIATAGHDGTVKLWDLATGRELPQTGGAALCAALSPDGKRLAIAGADRAVRFYDARSGKPLEAVLELDVPLAGLAFTGDGKQLITSGADRRIVRRDLATGKEEKVYAQPAAGEKVDRYTPVAVPRVCASPDGKYVAAVGPGSPLRIWKADGGLSKLSALPAPGPRVAAGIGCLAFGPDGRHVAIGGTDRRSVALYDLTTEREVRQFPTPAGVRELAFSRDGHALAIAGVGEGAVIVFETATGLPSRTFATGAAAAAAALAFSPDGRLLAAGCLDGKVRVWDLALGEELRSLDDHEAPVSCVGFGDGALVSADTATTARVWDAAVVRKGVKPLAAKRTPGELEALWSDLGGREADRAQSAIWALTAAPAHTLPLLRERLTRAIPDDDAKKIAKLIVQLDDDDFAVRENATQELTRLGKQAEQAVREALDNSSSAEVRRRAEAILDGLKAGGTGTPETLRAPRAVEVLEKVGTPEARKLVEELAKGPASSLLTKEAKAALARMRD